MLSPYILGALAHERHQTLLAQAETRRQARQARLHRQQAGRPGARRSPLRQRPAWLQPGRSRLFGHWPQSAVTGRPVVLRDGSTVMIRPVRPVDAQLLADGFARLSARSRRLRFLTPKTELSPAKLRYFTDLDHHDHEALGALDHADGRGVGIEGLHAEQHEVARADVCRIIGGLHRYPEVALDAAYPQPVLAQGLQVSAPREQVDLSSGPGEPGAEITPDTTRPVDSYPRH